MVIALLPALGAAGCGGGGSDPRPSSPLEKKAERIEQRLAGKPDDLHLLLVTMGAWIGAGNDRLSKIDTEKQPIPGAVARDFSAGLRAWESYLEQTGGEARVEDAEQAGGTYFSLLEIGSKDLGEIEANAAAAARAIRIAGRHRHNLFTLSNVAVYEYFNGEFAAGDRAARGAAADVSKADAKGVLEQLDSYRERGETFRGQLKRAAATLRESGDEQLEEPLKAYADSVGINREAPSE